MIESVLIFTLAGSVAALAFIAFIYGPEIAGWARKRRMMWRR